MYGGPYSSQKPCVFVCWSQFIHGGVRVREVGLHSRIGVQVLVFAVNDNARSWSSFKKSGVQVVVFENFIFWQVVLCAVAAVSSRVSSSSKP